MLSVLIFYDRIYCYKNCIGVVLQREYFIITILYCECRVCETVRVNGYLIRL